jgi:transcriptional regulator with XRE-family HTH domain
VVSDNIPLSYAKAVGDRLRGLRRQRGLSLLAVEEASGREFKASVLGAYERGERIISVLRLQRLAQIYQVPVDQVLPRGVTTDGHGPASQDGAQPDFSPKRPIRIDLVRLGESQSVEAQLVRRYLNMIQKQRGDFEGRSISIRDEDLSALARIFERDDLAMERKLVELGIHY